MSSQTSSYIVGISFIEPNVWLRADPKVPFQTHAVINLSSPLGSESEGEESGEGGNVSLAKVPARGSMMSQECLSQPCWLHP